MNRSFNLVLGISLCLAIVGGLWVMSSLNKEDGMWRPSDIYSQLGSSYSGASTFTNATLGSSSSSNNGVHVSLRGGSFSSRAHAPHYSYAPVSGGASGGVSLSGGRSSVAAGQGLYATSGAELRSFGGGGNASAGSSGGFRSNGQGAIAQASGISSPLSVNSVSYTPVLHTSSSASGDEMLAVAQASNVASASSYAGMGYTTATYGTASYGSTYGSSSARGISGRRGAAPTNNAYDTWLRWLQGYLQNNGIDPDESLDGNNIYNFDYNDAWDAFVAWFSNVYGCDPGDYTGADPSIIWEQWLSWFMSNNGTHNYGDDTYNFLPVGDYWPLLVLALLYVGYIAIRRRNKTKIANTLN